MLQRHLNLLVSSSHHGCLCPGPPSPIQGVMNACFDRSASTEQSLLLLRQFEELLQRESFRADLEAKYAAAFQSYSGEQGR